MAHRASADRLRASADRLRTAADRLRTAAPGTRPAAVEGLTALGATEPRLRQPVTDAICSWLRAFTGEDDAAGERQAALRLLTDRLRGGGATGEPPWDGVAVNLSGAVLRDADFRGCMLDGAEFADTRFHGTTSFDGAAFGGDAVFQRAVFYGDAAFTGARFAEDAAFGRARFRGRADFTGAVFGGAAWFGRGADTWWEDDPAWETADLIVPAPWDEPGEDDPEWPVAVLVEDYQDWEEGGDGARFLGDASFRGARFDGPAWFCHARFGAAAAFAGARFAGRVHLLQPAADLAGAHWGGGTADGESVWPLGWTVAHVPPGRGEGGALVPDASVAPCSGLLADADPAVRSTGPDALARLGDERPGLRQEIVTALCEYLRTPVPFDLRDCHRTAGRAAVLRSRREAQRVLADRLRPGPGQWRDMDLWLCGATLVDLDLSGCEARYADFTGAQFHGTTRFAGSRFDRALFTLGGPCGRAAFHGDVLFGAEPPDHVTVHGTVL